MAFTRPTPPTVSAEADGAVRLRSDLNQYRVGYQTVGQPWNAFKWAAPPTVEAESYSVYRSPTNFFSFVQTAPVNGTLAYLAYQTTVLYEDRSGFPRPLATDYRVMMFGRSTPVTANVYPWYVYAWQRTRPQDAEGYEIRPTRPDALSFWRNTYVAPSATPWPYGQLHWQQAVTVEPEPYRVSTPFPYQSFYWKSPYVPPPYPGQTIWDAIYEVVNDNMLVYPVEWVMSSTVPYGYVISRTPYPDSSQPNYTYIKIIASAGPPASLGYATVPDLTALRSFDASSLLETLGLLPGAITYAYSATIATGYVVSQGVLPGIALVLGSTISFVVSMGAYVAPGTVTVPNVVGMNKQTAISTLINANLMISTMIYTNSSGTAETIASQNPAAGTVVTLWGQINLTVYSG